MGCIVGGRKCITRVVTRKIKEKVISSGRRPGEVSLGPILAQGDEAIL